MATHAALPGESIRPLQGRSLCVSPYRGRCPRLLTRALAGRRAGRASRSGRLVRSSFNLRIHPRVQEEMWDMLCSLVESPYPVYHSLFLVLLAALACVDLASSFIEGY